MSRHRVAQDGVVAPERSPADRIAVLRRGYRRSGWVPGDGLRRGADTGGSAWLVRAPDHPGHQAAGAEAIRNDVLDADARGNGDSDDADRDRGDTGNGDWAAGDWAAGDTDDGVRDDGVADGGRVADDNPMWDAPDEPDAGRARRLRLGSRWHRLAETWVPEPLRDSRIDPGRRGALILSLIAALAAVAAAIGVWQDRPQPRPVQPVASAPVYETVSGSGSHSETSGTEADRSGNGEPPPATSAGPAVLAVSVTGLVRHPGLVQVPAGARVADAVAAAGGLAEGGTVTGLNLAAPLSDGDSVVVGAAGTAPPAAAGPGSGAAPAAGESDGSAADSRLGPVNLNSADSADLESLPGVGPVMAGNILAWREQNGSFTTVEQLQEVTGIGPSRFAQLRPLVTI